MTTEQIQKLKELSELLANGAISQIEFDNLKAGIIKQDVQIEVQLSQSNISKNAKKIRLKAFYGADSKLVSPPEISELDINDISKKDEKNLKAFLRLKRIFSPAEMTNDEIEIGNKLFTEYEVAQIDSLRPGFNYAFQSIISVLCSGAALFFITISPCFIILGAGTGLVASIFISITILNKVDATKLDKIFSYLALGLAVIAIIVYFNWG